MSGIQFSAPDEIIVDSFAGGGGTSTGIELATGRVVNIAINHDPDAILMHKTNHPHTRHLQASVWDVDPVKECGGSPVGLAWFSPDCKHFSKAKGAALVDRKIRGLAWIVLRWAGTVRPRVIILENVEEFQTWGPVRRGKPIKKKAGQTFKHNLLRLKRVIARYRKRRDAGKRVAFRMANSIISRCGQIKHCNNVNLYRILFKGERILRELKKIIRARQRKESLTWIMYLEQRAKSKSSKPRATPIPT